MLVAGAALTGGCDASDDFSGAEWARLQALVWSAMPPPPPDRSNAFAGDGATIALGQRFFSDARFSGPATQIDALRRPAAVARAPRGEPTGLSCASCHDLAHAGADTTSVPGNVSAGAGWTDVNALGLENCAYQQLYGWNGRADSLWAQAFAVAESPTTMNGNRLHTAWVIADDWDLEYDIIFGAAGQALPLARPSSAVAGLVGPGDDGQCTLDASGGCPAPCRAALATPPATGSGCWPRFPLDGKPGAAPGCQPGDAAEPFGDAFDCMDPADQTAVTRVLVNWAKALAAYEMTLVGAATPFDRFVAEGPASGAVGAAAKRGGRLFVGKAGCVDCHGTPLLSDRGFHAMGVPQAGPEVPTEADCPAGAACDCVAGKNCLPWGALDGLSKLRASGMLRTSMWSDDPGDDSRAADVARAPEDALEGAWRTPSLRSVSLTAPYMHDGVYRTLEEVVDHYNRGAPPARPLGLTAREQADLVAFLRTL